MKRRGPRMRFWSCARSRPVERFIPLRAIDPARIRAIGAAARDWWSRP